MTKQALVLAGITLIASHGFSQTKKTQPAQQDLLAQALDIALMVDDDWTQPSLIREIANSYIIKNQPDHAFAALQKIEGNERKSRAYLETADECRKAHPDVAFELLRRSSELARQVEDGDARATLYCFIGSKYFDIDQHSEALEALTLAAESAETISDKFKQCQMMSRIAAYYAQAGQTNAFDKTQNRCLEITARMDESFSKGMVLSSVAQNYATLGQDERYEAIIQSIQDPTQKGGAWNLITLQLADNGYIEQALQTSERITLPDSKAFALGRIAYQEAKQGNWEQAQELANRIETPNGKARSLAELAILSAELGHLDQAVQLLDEALTISENIEDKSAHDNVVYVLINGLNSAKQPTRAAKLALRLENASYYQHALANIATTQAKMGAFAQAFETIEQMENPLIKSRALLGIAEAQTAEPAAAEITVALALKENKKAGMESYQVMALVKADTILTMCGSRR